MTLKHCLGCGLPHPDPKNDQCQVVCSIRNRETGEINDYTGAELYAEKLKFALEEEAKAQERLGAVS